MYQFILFKSYHKNNVKHKTGQYKGHHVKSQTGVNKVDGHCKRNAERESAFLILFFFFFLRFFNNTKTSFSWCLWSLCIRAPTSLLISAFNHQILHCCLILWTDNLYTEPLLDKKTSLPSHLIVHLSIAALSPTTLVSCNAGLWLMQAENT